jgi:hypothetical protein
MGEHNEELLRQRAREKAVYRYTSALERGDFETVAAILAQAEIDTDLERMIVEVNVALATEHEAAAAENEAAQIRTLLQEHLPSGFVSDDDEIEPPPLTVATVAARMNEDAAQRGQMNQELLAFTRQLGAQARPLPTELSLGAVRLLLSELGISVSAGLVKQFRATAIYLAEGREHGQAFQAAARRQREMRQALKGSRPQQPDEHQDQQEDRR